jgi:membrane associated rhomboid family serine protease
MSMHTIHRPSRQSAIPAYKENAVLQLIIASGSTFIMYHFTRIIMLVAGMENKEVLHLLEPNIGLPAIGHYAAKAWTILTYGWVHPGFWDWFTNMIWLFCFGSVFQSLAGYKQLIPLYVTGLILGGACYLGGQFIPIAALQPGNMFFMGAGAGVTAAGIASLALEPKHRMHLSTAFSIPMVVVVAVYLLLNTIVAWPDHVPVLMIHAGGAIAGLIYAAVLKSGRRPGNYIYDTMDRIGSIATPNEERIKDRNHPKRNEVLRNMYEAKAGISQHSIDEILDKINEQGYRSLSREERDILVRAGKD